MLLDIVILPPEKIRKKIGNRLKKEVGSSPNYFAVDNIKLIPHLSLWHLKTSKNNINNIDKELQEVVKKQKPVKIIPSGLRDLKKFKGCVEFGVKKMNL